MIHKVDWLAVDRAQRAGPSRVDAELRSRTQTGGNDSQQRGGGARPGEALQFEGQYVPLVDTSDANVPLTNSDLDSMVKNFQPRNEAEHIPVRFGRANSDGPIVANISALRRDGSGLSGKLVRVDPRFDQLLKGKKLGGRAARSMRFERDPENGPSLKGYGYMPPRAYGPGAGMHEGDSTDAALTKLADADRAGEAIQFSAGDAGRIEFVIAEGSTKRAAAQHRRNDERLNDLATARARESKISFGEALAQCAKENPSLTRPDGFISAFAEGAHQGETFRFQRNSERLNELAKQRAEEDDISFGEALSQVAADNPRLTLPDGVILLESDFAETPPKSNGQQLADLANQRARKKKITFGEALAEVAQAHPELTLPDARGN